MPARTTASVALFLVLLEIHHASGNLPQLLPQARLLKKLFLLQQAIRLLVKKLLCGKFKVWFCCGVGNYCVLLHVWRGHMTLANTCIADWSYNANGITDCKGEVCFYDVERACTFRSSSENKFIVWQLYISFASATMICVKRFICISDYPYVGKMEVCVYVLHGYAE